MIKLNKNITLIGMPGSGKTVIAREIKKLVHCNVVDADNEIIVAAGRPISDIFQDFGEENFRQGERKVIKRILTDSNIVLSAGGGAYINPQTRSIIDANSYSVWLDIDIETLWRRIKGKKHRPMLRGINARQTLQDLYDVRTPLYALSNLHVKHENNTATQMAKKIVELLKNESLKNEDKILIEKSGKHKNAK